MPGTESVVVDQIQQMVREAAQQRGYEAGLLCIIVLGTFATLGWVVRWWITKATEREDKSLAQALERETRLAARVTELERMINEQMLGALNKASLAMDAITRTMVDLTNQLATTRPCFWAAERQEQVLTQAADRIATHVIGLVERASFRKSKGSESESA